MRIGIDIDDVITDTSGAMRKYIEKYDHTGEIHEHIEEVMRGEMPTQAIKIFLDETAYNIFKDTKIKKDADVVIEQLLNDGHKIYLITSRGDLKFKDSERLTIEFLKLNNINYTEILFNSFEKAKVCKENNIDIMIDDSVKFCEEVEKNNIKGILYTSVVNKSANTSVTRVNDWLELKDKINQIITNE